MSLLHTYIKTQQMSGSMGQVVHLTRNLSVMSLSPNKQGALVVSLSKIHYPHCLKLIDC